jgi:hypothetical protein
MEVAAVRGPLTEGAQHRLVVNEQKEGLATEEVGPLCECQRGHRSLEGHDLCLPRLQVPKEVGGGSALHPETVALEVRYCTQTPTPLRVSVHNTHGGGVEAEDARGRIALQPC